MRQNHSMLSPYDLLVLLVICLKRALHFYLNFVKRLLKFRIKLIAIKNYYHQSHKKQKLLTKKLKNHNSPPLASPGRRCHTIQNS
jgi:phage regulator Rha-like protein